MGALSALGIDLTILGQLNIAPPILAPVSGSASVDAAAAATAVHSEEADVLQADVLQADVLQAESDPKYDRPQRRVRSINQIMYGDRGVRRVVRRRRK
ncbi:hypothetical protein OROMI_033041 [Orobanche minor]